MTAPALPFFLLTLAAAASLPAQQPAAARDAAATARQAQDASEKTEQAESLFRRAVEAQTVSGEPAPVEGFYVQLYVKERAESVNDIQFEHLYREDQGGLVRQRLIDPESGVLIEKGFDGRDYWQWTVEGEHKDELLDLRSQKEFRKDRDSIDRAIESSQTLLLVFDLEQLRSQARELRLEQTETGPILSGKLPRPDGEWSFRLELAHEDLSPLALRLDSPGFGEPVEEGAEAPTSNWFVLRGHSEIQGRRIPRLIEMYGPERGAQPDRILEVHELTWRKPPSLESFKPPRPLHAAASPRQTQD